MDYASGIIIAAVAIALDTVAVRRMIAYMENSLKVGMVVKFTEPEAGEENLRFTILEHNGDRVYIQLICDLPIKPVECVAPHHVMEDK